MSTSIKKHVKWKNSKEWKAMVEWKKDREIILSWRSNSNEIKSEVTIKDKNELAWFLIEGWLHFWFSLAKWMWFDEELKAMLLKEWWKEILKNREEVNRDEFNDD
jgi:hypothetical protein